MEDINAREIPFGLIGDFLVELKKRIQRR